MNNNPIGIFDSGLGGLSVWREIRKALPNESLMYFGDGLRCPYGSKSVDQVCSYTVECVEQMLSEGAKMIVLACNTATAAAIDVLRSKYPKVPFVGMEPAVKPAVVTTKSGVVGILATEGSLKGELFNNTVAKYNNGTQIITAVGEGFVSIVENGQEDTSLAYEAVKKVIDPMLECGVDRLVLGCTHYPFLIEQMLKVIGNRGVQIIDPAKAVTRRVMQLLKDHNLAAATDNKAENVFRSLGNAEYLNRLKEKALQALNEDI